ncbi:MAG: peptidase M23 [Methylococcaceae bacterium]|nr:MAG: peptidase M23 [Methylococcaceae bacterium]
MIRAMSAYPVKLNSYSCSRAGWCLLLCCAASPAWAAPPQAEQLQKRIQAVQDSLGLVETRKDSLQGELGEIERHSGDIVKHLRMLDRDVARQQQQLAHIHQQKDKLLASLRENNRALDRQVRAAYMTGRQEWLKLLLNPDDPALLSRMFTYYGYLNRNRLAQLRNIHDGLAQVAAMEQSTQAEKARLEQLQAQVREEQNDLGIARRDRENTLARLREALRDKNAHLSELTGNMQRLDRLVSSVELALADIPKPPPPGKPHAPPAIRQTPAVAGQWPVAGPLLKQFGASRMGGHWDGVLIKAEEGAPVKAAADGRVVFADWMRGYGLLVIVEHDNDYMTLYAFNQSFYKAVGDQVTAGETIATVGRTGGRTGSSLYFGVRLAGRPVDPLGWLQRRG